MSFLKKRSDEENVTDDVVQENVSEEQNLTKAERRAMRKARKSAPTITDDYDESDRTLDDSEAHRDVVYELPSTLKQVWVCYMTQMKRFTKEKTIWSLLILLLLIPVMYYAITYLSEYYGLASSNVVNVLIATPLIGMPVISLFICANVCGSMLPREFNERTVYLTLPLPLSRFAFFIGKFLAGLTLVWGVISAAYGISILLALFAGDAEIAYTSSMFNSLLIILTTSFACCAFVYMLSATSKRGASMKSMLLLIVALPALIILLNVLTNVEALSSMSGVLEPLSNAVMYLPVLGPDLALGYLGLSPFSVYMGINWASLTAFANVMATGIIDIQYSMNAYLMAVVAIVLGVLCLLRGYFKIKRRNM